MRTFTTKCSIEYLIVLDEQPHHGVLRNTKVLERLKRLPQAAPSSKKGRRGGGDRDGEGGGEGGGGEGGGGAFQIHLRHPNVTCSIDHRQSKRGYNIKITNARHEGEIHAAMIKVGNLFRDALGMKAKEEEEVQEEAALEKAEKADAEMQEAAEETFETKLNVKELKERKKCVDLITRHMLPQIYHHNLMQQKLKAMVSGKSGFLKLKAWNDHNREFDAAYKHQCLLKTIFPTSFRAWWRNRWDGNNVSENISLVMQHENESLTDFYNTLCRVKSSNNEILFGKTEVDEQVVLKRSKHELMKQLSRNLCDINRMYKYYKVKYVPRAIDQKNLDQILPDEMVEITDYETGTTFNVSSIIEAGVLKNRSMTVIPKLVVQPIPKAANIQWDLPDFSIEYDKVKWALFVKNILEGKLYIKGHLIVAYIHEPGDNISFGDRLKLPEPVDTLNGNDTSGVNLVGSTDLSNVRPQAYSSSAVSTDLFNVSDLIESTDASKRPREYDDQSTNKTLRTDEDQSSPPTPISTWLQIHIIRTDVTEDPLELERIWNAHISNRSEQPAIYRNLMEWLLDFIIDSAQEAYEKNTWKLIIDPSFRSESTWSELVNKEWLVALKRNPLLLEFVPSLERGTIENYIKLVQAAIEADFKAFDKIDHSPFTSETLLDEEIRSRQLEDAQRGMVDEYNEEMSKPIMLDKMFQKWLIDNVGPGVVRMASFPYNLYTNLASDNEPTNYDTKWGKELIEARKYFNEEVLKNLSDPDGYPTNSNFKETFTAANQPCVYKRDEGKAVLTKEDGLRILENRWISRDGTPYKFQQRLIDGGIWSRSTNTIEGDPAPLWWKIHALRAPQWLPKVYEFMQSRGNDQLKWNDQALPDLLPDEHTMNNLRTLYQYLIDGSKNIDSMSRTNWNADKIQKAFERHDQAIYDSVNDSLQWDLTKALMSDKAKEMGEKRRLRRYMRLPRQQQNAEDMMQQEPSLYNRVLYDASVLAVEKSKLDKSKDQMTLYEECKKMLYLANHLLGRDLSYYRLSSMLQTPQDFYDAAMDRFAMESERRVDESERDVRIQNLRKEFNDRRIRVFNHQIDLGQPEIVIKITQDPYNPDDMITPTASITHPAARAYAFEMSTAIQDLMCEL